MVKAVKRSALLLIFVPAMLCLVSCGLGKQGLRPGCTEQTVAWADKHEGNLRGSVIILDDGHKYENAEKEQILVNGRPRTLPAGTAVVVCPAGSPGMFEISEDVMGSLFADFRRQESSCNGTVSAPDFSHSSGTRHSSALLRKAPK